MDQLIAKNIILEYNHRFNKYIIHDCPCYATEYANFSDVIINNKSYNACILVRKNNVAKIVHLKLPIMFGSLIDFTIRGKDMNNYLQFGGLFLDGWVKLIYNFLSNNLSNGHVYTIRKTNTQTYQMNLKGSDYSLYMNYNPSKEAPIDATIRDEKYEANNSLKRNLERANILMDDEKLSGCGKYKRRKYNNNKTKAVKKAEKLQQIFNEKYNKEIQDKSGSMDWIDIVNNFTKDKLSNVNKEFEHATITTEDQLAYFDACLKHAPKLDDLSNKVTRTCTYILFIGMKCIIDSCYAQDPAMKALGTRLNNQYKTGNLFCTLTQTVDAETYKQIKGFKSIYQVIEAHRINLASTLVSTVKKNVNASIKNSKALCYARDGYPFLCPLDSREMKDAGISILLSQLVIIPKELEFNKVIEYFEQNHEELAKPNAEGEEPLRCVINSLMYKYRVVKSNLLKIKAVFPTIVFGIYNSFLNITTTGYNQMKFSIKYNCFIGPYEYQHIWPDAFENYHPHLNYNSCIMGMPESIHLGLPAKLTVANTNIRGRCADINTITELQIFLHTNGASNAAICHRALKNDKLARITFENKIHPGDHKIIIPIGLSNPHLRYLNVGFLGKVQPEYIPENVKQWHEAFKPIEDASEVFGVSLNDILPNAKKVYKRIDGIMNDLYTNDERLVFIDIDKTNPEEKKAKPVTIVTENNQRKHVTLDDKNMKIRCYTVKNNDIKKEYEKQMNFSTDVHHPPNMYIPIAFGDIQGGTNEDGLIIDEKLVKYGPKKLITQTLSVTFNYEKPKDREGLFIKYHKNNSAINDVITFGCLESNIPLTFKQKTKNTNISAVIIKPNIHKYTISITGVPDFEKYISSFFDEKTNQVKIHYSFLTPITVGTKLATCHGQKGIVSTITDLSNIVGYTKTGEMYHPLMLISPTSILGRTMASQVMSMFSQSKRAFTPDGKLIAPHGVNIHHIDPNKTKISKIKHDLMTNENGFVSNSLSYSMKVLNTQKSNNHYHFNKIMELCKLQGIHFKLTGFLPDVLSRTDDKEDDDVVCT
ncbi:LEF-8 [Macrobrachium rosenbergii nudivirus]|nr:LEF-8 [Macrobrachium rosenbergii nudivirus]